MAIQRNKKAPIKKVTRVVPRGKMYVTATFNNTIVTVTDEQGNTLAWSSTGALGFPGSRKSTPYAATVTLEKAVEMAKAHGMNSMEVFIKGPGPGRDAALRVIRAQGMKVSLLADLTPVPHNGTRSRKRKHG
jgi:small subunit ribosomal protein S11